MSYTVDGKTATEPSPEQVRAQLSRILGSPLFSGARRLSQFLEFVVSRSLQGQAADIKESLIGVEVYGREATYDPKSDSIVRAEASRLRAKLREYYEVEGISDPLRIDLPKGSYTPAFALTAPSPPSTPADVVSPRRSWRWPAVFGALILVAVAAAWSARNLRRVSSIAVMPPTNLAPNGTRDPLGDTLTEQLTRALLASKQWRVAGRAPTVDLSGRNQALTPLRQNLGADVVLTGSYRLIDNANVRLTLQVVNVADGYLLWTQTYHRRMADLAEAQNELANAAVAELTLKLTGRAARRGGKEYAQAREAWSTYTPQGLRESVKLFQQAMQADPSFAPAWAGFADASLRLSDLAGEDEKARLAEARRAAAKAIALDDSNAEAHAALGRLYLFKEWNFQGAAEQLQRSVTLDPVRVSPNVHYSQALSILGQMNDAEEAILAARAHFPPVPELLLQQGSVYFLARKFEKMESIGHELIALNASSVAGHWLAGVAMEQQGRVPAAIAEFQTGLAQSAKDDLRTLCALSHAYAMAGDRTRAIETMGSYYRPGRETVTRFDLPYCVAMTFTALKQKDEAFAWLEKARTSRDASFPFFPFDPRFDPLRGDTRYDRLAASLK